MIINTYKNLLIAYGTIWEGDGAYFLSNLNKLEAEYSNIVVHLHTGGGSVFDGNLIYNGLNKSENVEKIVIDGLAASMGSVIMLSRQVVEIVENGYVMIHAASAGAYGNAKDMESTANLLRLVEKNFITKLIERTGKSKEEVEKWMDGSDYWFDAEQCLEMGLVTAIIPARVTTPITIEDPNKMEASEVYNIYASLLTASLPTNQQNIINPINTDMKQPLISALGLTGVSAQSSDTVVVEAVKAKIQAVEQERDQAIKDRDDQIKSQTKVILDQQEGKAFTKEQREVYENIGVKSGVEALLTVLGQSANAQAPNISNLIQTGDTDPRADWDFDKWQKEDPKGLEVMASKNPAQYNVLFNAKYNRK